MAQPVLLDVSRLIWRAWLGLLPTGIDRACIAYVRHYRGRALAVVQRGGMTRVLNAALSEQLFDVLTDPPTTLRWRLLGIAARALMPGSGANTREIRGALYLNVGHTGLDRSGHALWVKRSGVRATYYVHDLIPITYPQFARAGVPERHTMRMRTVLRLGAAVIANSTDSVQALGAFAKGQGLSMPLALIAPLGVEAQAPLKSVPALFDAPYFVMLGTIEGRKNHALMLRVWRGLIARLGEATPRLVIIGQRGWQADEIFRQLDSDAALQTYVKELGRCDDVELHRWLSHARALLFPSFVEGQGLPLTGALAAGVPVIASDLAVFRETAGTVPDYIDPHDQAAWEAAVLDYAAQHSKARAQQMERMQGFAPPAWDTHFRTVELGSGPIDL